MGRVGEGGKARRMRDGEGRGGDGLHANRLIIGFYLDRKWRVHLILNRHGRRGGIRGTMRERSYFLIRVSVSETPLSLNLTLFCSI